ncbi:MAG: tetratricopeptide repeat protein [Ignavibacteria bacterium]|nr:tetratricopeptide repeat protein [Ignavibacteria bacterium]
MKIFFALIFLLFVAGCGQYTNFTTYFNTYYNCQRLMKEAEDEFEYQDIKLKAKPRLVVPLKDLQPVENIPSGPPPFMQEFIISPVKLQPVKTKLDSIVIKGSKILSRYAKSDFVEGSLYLMAKSYFYKSEYLPSQIKCSELVDKFPAGDLSPDAHLLLSKNLLVQRKFHSGKVLLSRTVDIAWQKERYDILSEAFRLQAELSLFENNIDGALRPYRQAIAQTDDNKLRARWQFDLASIYYRLGNWEDALLAFRKVRNYNPDYLTLYESYFYEALSNIRLGNFGEGEKILTQLKKDAKFQEWNDFTHSGFMLSAILKNDAKEFRKLETYADSAYKVSPAFIPVFYEKAINEYNSGNYNEARKYFARARNVRTPVLASADKMFNLLNNWEQKYRLAEPLLAEYFKAEIPDSSRTLLATTLFEIGAIFERLGFIDSTIRYYRLAYEVSPPSDTNTARYIYSFARIIQDRNLFLSDSLKEILVEKYPNTIFGKEVLAELGFTKNYLIDTTAELFTSGLRLIRNKEFKFGLNQLREVYIRYPKSSLAPRSLFLIGYTFERDIKHYDSAYFYYKILVDEYPESVYANDVRISVTFFDIVRKGEPIPDSLKERQVIPRHPVGQIKGIEPLPSLSEPTQKDEVDKDGFNPLDYFKDPSKIIKDVREIFKPENLQPDINLPKNPLDEFKPKTDSLEKKKNVPQLEEEIEQPKK